MRVSGKAVPGFRQILEGMCATKGHRTPALKCPGGRAHPLFPWQEGLSSL